MFDKQFLQILAVRLSGGMSLDWKEPEPRYRPMPEEEILPADPLGYSRGLEPNAHIRGSTGNAVQTDRLDPRS
jgi:hypothetical protein